LLNLALRIPPLTLLVLLGVAPLKAQVDPLTGPSSTPGSEDRCTVRIIDADTLKIDDDPFYVDPLVAESDSGGRILLLGRVIHRYNLDPARPRKVPTRSLLGTVVLPNGRAAVVDAPVAGPRFDGIRAVALPGGRWGIVFAEVRSPLDVPFDTASALWYGEYDGQRWSGVERLPMPDPAIDLQMASSLVLSEGGMTWVVKTSTQRPSIAILRRTGGRWTSEKVFTPATYVQPTLSRGGRVDLAVV